MQHVHGTNFALNHPVASALIPVVLLIAMGFLAGKRQWIGAASVKDLSSLVFMVLAVRKAVIRPVPLPIMAGLLFGQTGLQIPDVIDRPLRLLGAG